MGKGSVDANISQTTCPIKRRSRGAGGACVPTQALVDNELDMGVAPPPKILE